MTEELKQKAEAEADKVIISSGMDRASVIHLKHLLVTMYIAGVNENGVQWHDLRKDPNDLPQKYIPVLNQDGEHRIYDGSYWRDYDDVIYTNVIAWCEIPQFKE